MRTTFLLENLLGKTSLLNSAVSPRAQLPALAGILIETGKGKVRFSSTDLETGVVCEIPGATEEEGKSLVLAQPFLETITSLSEEKITIQREEKETSVSGKKFHAKISSLDETEFPKIIEEKGEKIMEVGKDEGKKTFGRVAFAAAQDAARPAFSAVLIKQERGMTQVVATDSHRLSRVVIKKGGRQKDDQALIPAKIIKAQISQKDTDAISLFVSRKNNQACLEQNNDLLVGRLIDAEYPEFQKIIPADSSTRAEFDKEEMQSAIRTASVFARDNANIVRFSVKKDRISLFAKSPTLGEENIDIEAKTTGEENEIAFNSRYLIELLQNSGAETMIFEMQGPLNPGVFKILGDDSFIHLIMPIRVREEV